MDAPLVYRARQMPAASRRKAPALVIFAVSLLLLHVGNFRAAFCNFPEKHETKRQLGGPGVEHSADVLPPRSMVTKLKARGGAEPSATGIVDARTKASPRADVSGGSGSPAFRLGHDTIARRIATGPFAYEDATMDTIKLLFGWIDQKRRGRITREEMYEGYRSISGPFSRMNQKSVDFVFEEADLNMDGYVDIGEFTIWSQETNELMLNYAEADKDLDGLIDFTEFKEVLDRQGLVWPAPPQRMFATIDQNRDGYISFWQYVGASRLRERLKGLSRQQLEELCVLQYPQDQIDDALAEEDPKVALVELIIKNYALHW